MTRIRMIRIRIWDLPTRLFHLGLIGSVGGALVTHYLPGDTLVWHARFGYAALSLVLFRLGWGLFGSRYARFSAMLHSPRTILHYASGRLKHSGRPWVGHNPLGALSVVAMLLLVLTQASLGLFANDDIAFEGPWAHHVDKALSDLLTWVHADVTALGLYALIGLHLLAVLYHRIQGRINLVPPMLTGDLLWPEAHPQPQPARDNLAVRFGGLLHFAVCAMTVAWLTQL